MANLRFVNLLWIFLAHLAGIYLFTRGFLLMRLSLTDISTPNFKTALQPTHSRAVILVIDALRFDFVSPDPPTPPSPFHHNILTLPQRLTKEQPFNSFLFDSHADPPTTTLQRIKGLTTGSLPTFIDVGNNLGASSITEDSIMVQLQRAGKKVAFMGDDTWMSVFPDAFNISHPFPSFDVEDLHTVDEGVIEHLFPLLEDPSKPFDFLIGHFLGVDHVGHRAGPDHPLMKAKLQQMEGVLNRVVENLDDDTLLVLLGDHGMDRSGDHGGDSTLETSSAMWIYSKGPALAQTLEDIPTDLLPLRKFPGASVGHRFIQQIDLLPTLSLLLGLPIPFNNLGSIIPEVFARPKQLEAALELNDAQIHNFLHTYRASPSGSELDEAWDSLSRSWDGVRSSVEGERRSIALNKYSRHALAACRAMWAQFNATLMGMGLVLFAMSLLASWSLYVGLTKAGVKSDEWLKAHSPQWLIAGLGGGISGFAVSFVTRAFPTLLEGVGMTDYIVFGATFASCAAAIFVSPPITSFAVSLSPILLILHAAAFLSNSFTVWEDYIIPFLAVTSVVPYAMKGFTAPTTRLRYRIVGFSALYAVGVRLMSLSTVCREEQQSFCHVTFYASSSVTAPPLGAVILAIPIAIALPIIIGRFLSISLSNKGIAKTYYPVIFSPSILGGALYWILEWADTTSALGDSWNPTLRLARTWIARFAFVWVLVAGGLLWFVIPLCVHLAVGSEDGQKQVKVIGFANVFGSPYLVFWTIFLAVVYTASQIPGQLVLGVATVCLLSFLEVIDSVRDVQSMEIAFASATPSSILDPTSALAQHVPVRFSDIVPIALLGLHAFYTTGHQSTISSIQWKTAFLITPGVKYPWSAITVVLNSIGPLFLFALAIPLVALWNQTPQPTTANVKDSAGHVKADSLVAGIAMMTYYATLLFGTSISAAVLRRHLMVWKIFAPRFMAGVLGVVAVDLGVLLGVGLGVGRVAGYVSAFFRKLNASSSSAVEKKDQ
ncbi:phosphoethanolamine N-methyltransferase [Coprinopsis sp. MPI-PUGE-AT-0042]|nr:phosphoethanolamine N-methyltransferase [Coprinopsis sp. MPI-PUGE-AT-0042]